MKTTALITGASSGIGAALARELAADQHDLILVARNAAAMQTLGAELSAKYGTAVTVLDTDLTKPGASAELHRRVTERGLHVDVLINNAGVGFCDFFHRQDPQRIHAMIALSITALTELTRLFLPDMVARKRGGVINVASTAAYLPEPTMAVYAASKAYVLSFTVALTEELRGTGVNATVVCPGPTKSNFARAAQMEHIFMFSDSLAMDADVVARAACAGLKRGSRVTIPGFGNRLNAMMARLMPYRILLPATQRLLAVRS